MSLKDILDLLDSWLDENDTILTDGEIDFINAFIVQERRIAEDETVITAEKLVKVAKYGYIRGILESRSICIEDDTILKDIL